MTAKGSDDSCTHSWVEVQDMNPECRESKKWDNDSKNVSFTPRETRCLLSKAIPYMNTHGRIFWDKGQSVLLLYDVQEHKRSMKN